MKVRKATNSDVKILQNLNLDLFKFERQFGKTYSLKWSISELGQKYFENLINKENGIVFVAVEKSEIIGYIAGYNFTNSCRIDKHMAEVENMYIKPEFRGKGIGTKLVEEFENEAKARGVKLLKVGSLVPNCDAVDFYKSKGFEEHEVILEKNL